MNTINYRIKSMQVAKSCITPQNYTEEGEIQIHNSLSFTMVIKKCMLLCRHCLVLRKQKDIFAEIILETIFVISPNSVEGMKTDNKLIIPRGFLVQCGSISYGTLRGVVLTKANEKGIDNVTIPPIYINTIIKDAITIDLKDKNKP